MAVELPTGVFATSLRPAFTRILCSVSTLLLFYSLLLHFIYLLLRFLVNILYILLCNIVTYILKVHIIAHLVTWFQNVISVRNNHFHGELIHLFTSSGIINASLRFSIILNTKFFISLHILTIFLSFIRIYSPGHMTMTSHPKWRSTDRLFENIYFLSDYCIPRSVYAVLFHDSSCIILSEHNV